MASINRAFFRVAIFGFIVTSLCAIGYFFGDGHAPSRDLLHQQFPGVKAINEKASKLKHGTPLPLTKETLKSLLLTEAQCKGTFPNLRKDINMSVKRGKFILRKSDPDYKGLVQGRIHDGKLYIISIARDTAEEVLSERNAILHSLHRAISTSPEPLPDTHFALVLNDEPKNKTWSFARPNKPIPINLFLMPHFASWSWSLPFVGTMDEALDRINVVEEKTNFDRKIDKAVWRGTAWFNPIANKDLRPNLLKQTKGKEWADVEKLQWDSGGANANNSLSISDFCKYKYVIYTEGVTYSGRLPYHQACASVLITPPLTYLQHTSHLIHPIHATDLLHPPSKYSRRKFSNARRPLLSMTTDPSSANAIYVSPDWSDLEALINYLRANPMIAKGIAERGRKSTVGGGYLSQAAEACYWRSLIRGWANVAVVDESDDDHIDADRESGWGKNGGVRWETFVLKGREAFEKG